MYKIILLLVLVLVPSMAQARDPGYEIQSISPMIGVIYQTEISSSAPMWINWTTQDLGMSGKLRIGLQDDGSTYFLCVLKVPG